MRAAKFCLLAALLFAAPLAKASIDSREAMDVSLSVFFASSKDSIDFGSGGMAGYRFRVDGSEFLWLGFRGGYLESADFLSSFSAAIQEAFGTQNVRVMSSRLIPLLVTGTLQPGYGWFRPYVGLGLGAFFTRVTATNNTTGERKTIGRTYLHGSIGGGIDLVISDTVGLHLEPLRLGLLSDRFFGSADLGLSMYW